MSTSTVDHKLFTKVAAILLTPCNAQLVGAPIKEANRAGMLIPVGVSIPVVVVVGGLAAMVWRESNAK